MSMAGTGTAGTVWRAASGGPGLAVAMWRHLNRPAPLLHTATDLLTVAEPRLPAAAGGTDLQLAEHGVGPPYHRRYRVLIRNAVLGPSQLVDALLADLNAAAPRECMWFAGAGPGLRPGDDVHIGLAGPWDAPVRMITRTPTRFAFATLRGHPEAGQIEFRAGHVGGVPAFEIQSWARSAGPVADLLYDRLRVTRELQTHVWAHFCERAAVIAGGRADGIAVHTGRVDAR
ncbi:MAG: DUF1990 family protein [Pseudonocardia sp.]